MKGRSASYYLQPSDDQLVEEPIAHLGMVIGRCKAMNGMLSPGAEVIILPANST